MTDWKNCLQSFKAYLLLEKSLSKHSIEAYIRDVGKLLEYVLIKKIDLRPTEMKEDHLVGFVYYLDELGLEAKSQARMISGIRAFYKYLLMEDLINTDPSAAMESPKLKRTLPDVMSYEEINAIISAIDLSLPQGHRNKAIIETLYACGLRVSELVTLRISNLFFEEGFVKVTGKNNKERLVPIGPKAKKDILFYLDQERKNLPLIDKNYEDFVFLNRRGKGLTRVMIFTIIKELSSLAGIQKNVSPHTFRHSFATHLVEGGADLRAVQEMLGHESITTTEMYTHIDRNYLRETILQFHPLSKILRKNK
ncbi:MAG: site-specific tyrosine recombinase XerD [Saprospiraceae bacterium]|nr:site-specific tyrosine recombinase XerD [Saprospiraceae bacterium]